jgi:hypothetical protein
MGPRRNSFQDCRRLIMGIRRVVTAIALGALVVGAVGSAVAADLDKYPNFKGQWLREGAPRWVKPGEKPPLTPEYMKVFEANQADMANGGQGDVPSWYCLPQGMPMMMNIYDPMEMIVTPDVTYVLISHVNDSYRRIYTDGRDWPKEPETTFAGYSIGKWIDEDGDGRYDVLEVETRYLRNPHTYDSTGIPFHQDGKAWVKERIYLDTKDPEVLHDEITTYDNALTKPWTVVKTARRNPEPQPSWVSEVCAENNALVRIGKDPYFLSSDGYLMPTRKGQKPPDPRYFDSAR